MPRRTWKPSGKHRRLFAGPWIGEFGWELFGWHARLRWLRKHVYDKVIVHCKPGHEHLYEDFAELNAYPNSACMHEAREWDVLSSGQLPVSYAWNWHDAKVRRNGFYEQEWKKFGRNIEGLGVDVLIHARKREWNSGVNWSRANWLSFVERLDAEGVRIAQIGMRHQTYNLGVMDFRGQPLENLVNIMASSRMIVGTSSGPMHLASLCGLKHLVLSDDTNVMRYKLHWNPFDTDCRITGAWHSPIPQVYALTKEMLNE